MMLAALAMAAAVDVQVQVADLAWLAGAWREDKGGTVTRETWLAPLGGAMAGASQTNRAGRARVEFMTITAEPAGVTFTARLDGQPPTPFVLKPGPDGEAVFENLAHDFPQRVIYRRCGERLCARIEGTVAGKLRAQEWTYTRER